MINNDQDGSESTRLRLRLCCHRSATYSRHCPC